MNGSIVLHVVVNVMSAAHATSITPYKISPTVSNPTMWEARKAVGPAAHHTNASA